MAAELELHATVSSRRLLPHAAADGHGAREGDRTHVRVAVNLRAGRRARPGEDVEHAWGQPSLGEALGHVEARPGRVVRELENGRVPVDQCGRELPYGDRDREVPGGDETDDAERTAERVETLVRDRRLVLLPDCAPRLPCREPQDRRRPQRLELGLADWLSHLGGHVLCDPPGPCLDRRRRRDEIPGALLSREPGPARECLACGLDRGACVIGAGGRIHTRDLGRAPGISLLVRLPGDAPLPVTVDVVPGRGAGDGLRHGRGSFRGGWRRGRRDWSAFRCLARGSRRRGPARA